MLNVTSVLTKAVRATTSSTFKAGTCLACEPALSGALLFLLTRAPTKFRQQLIALLHRRFGISGKRLVKLVRILKYLSAFGITWKIHKFLERLANHNWYWKLWKKPGVPFVWDGKTELVIITGGCSGFGYEMVKKFSNKARIVIIDVQEMPEEFADVPNIYYFLCDLGDFDRLGSTVNGIRDQVGHPSVLINNGGFGAARPITESPNEFYDKIIRVNLTAQFILIKEFLPAMLEAEKGHIVTIASMASFASFPTLIAYGVTKVGSLFLHEGLRNELLSQYPTGYTIQTSCIHPASHATNFFKGYEHMLEAAGVKLLPPVNVANAVTKHVFQGRGGKIFVPESAIDESWLRYYPVWYQDWVVGNIKLFGKR